MINLRRDGEYLKLGIKRLELAKGAIFYFGHVEAYLESQGMSVVASTFWDEKVKKPNTMTTTRRVGKILLAENANISDTILNDSYLRPADFEILQAANSSGGIDKKTREYTFILTDLSSRSYPEISALIQEENDFQERGIEPVEGSWIDYILLSGNDPATNQQLLIEAGNPPIKKEHWIGKIIPKKILRERVYNLS